MASIIFLLFLLATAEARPTGKDQKVSRQFDSKDPYADWPSYDDLPLDPTYPTKAAWGVWGANDVNG